MNYEKCNKCYNIGWIPYYEKYSDGKLKRHQLCYKCKGTGYVDDNLGILGSPGDQWIPNNS